MGAHFRHVARRHLHGARKLDKLSSVTQSFSYMMYTAGVRPARVERMPSPEFRASVEVIRREAELAVDAASLRVVAAQMGISAMGLRAFIGDANKPQARTLRKLGAWYADHVAARGNSGEHEARILVALLLSFYPRADHPRIRRNFLDERERDFRESGMEPPHWIAVLRAELPDP